jgi:hypothetical protein
MSSTLPERPMTDAAPTAATHDLVSVIMVVSERAEPLAPIYAEYAAALRDAGYHDFQFVFVSGRDWRRWLDPVLALRRAGEPIQVLEAAQNVGETALLRSAFGHCSGSIIVTVPSYRRIEPTALPRLIRRIEEGNSHLVVACRSQQHDAWFNRVQRRVVHGLIRRAVGGDFHDLGSGVRVMRAEVLREVPLYGEFSRFLPLLASREGFTAEEVLVPQDEADRHARVHAPGVYLRRLIDLAGVFFLIRFREKPLRFFGLVGSVLSAVGGLMLLVMFFQRIFGQSLADRPLLLLAVLLTVTGLQAIALGLVGEIIVHTTTRRHTSYRLSRRSDAD